MNGVQHKVVGVGFGLAGAYFVTAGLNDPYGVLIAATSVVGCMLPDIDHDRTKIGRKRKVFTDVTTAVANTIIICGIILGMVATFFVIKGFVDFGMSPTKLMTVTLGFFGVFVLKKIISRMELVRWATKHRGLMHTLVVPVLLYFGSTVSSFPLYHYSLLGLLVGYVSHLFADMLTVEGCPVLFPLTKNNIRFPTRFKTKDKVCTRAAYTVAVLAVAGSVAVVYLFL